MLARIERASYDVGMPTIFINYRRDDSAGYAGRIHERLASVFGSKSVFIDLDDIAPGVNFVSTIEESVAACDVMLVLIGKRWLDSRDGSGQRRIDDPADFVRVEIGKGLARNVRIIPVLIGGASMPAEKDLPPELGPLTRIQAIALSDERWDYDTSQLVKAVAGPVAPPRGLRRRWVAMAVGVVALVGVVVALMLWGARSSPDLSRSSPVLSGRWTADVQYDYGGRHSEIFVFRTNNGALAGTASFLGVARGIVDGKLDGAKVSFTTRTDEAAGDQTRQAEHHYDGTFSGDDIRFVMQTEGGFSPHPPLEFVARRTEPLSESRSTDTRSSDSAKPAVSFRPPEAGTSQVPAKPWSEAQAILTLTDGRVVEVRAETFSNCISVAHGLSLEGGQSIEFEKLKSFDVLRADTWLAPNAKAKLRLTLLNGTTTEGSVAANCDLFGYNDLGRFTAFFEKLKRVEFQR